MDINKVGSVLECGHTLILPSPSLTSRPQKQSVFHEGVIFLEPASEPVQMSGEAPAFEAHLVFTSYLSDLCGVFSKKICQIK